jgi:hypothetical protein
MLEQSPLLAARSKARCCSLLPHRYIALWIGLSAAVILVNKYILAYTGFPYPIALTLTHMAFCSTLAASLIKLGACEPAAMDSSTYIRCAASRYRGLLTWLVSWGTR